MKRIQFVVLPLAVAALAACQSEAEKQADATEDRIEQQADQSAAAAGDEIAALGLTERQLLDADLVTADGTELGDIEQVRRGAGGAVTSLVVEIEDSSPDRYVDVPLTGLTVREGAMGDTDIQTSMTAQALAGLPDFTPGAP